MKTLLLAWLGLFVARQKLVQQAMTELRPDLLAVAALPGMADKEEKMRAMELFAKYRRIPQSGIWQDAVGEAWDYFVHGMGCRLIHTTTREPLEWDAPDPEVFDRHWFLNWVKWRAQQPEHYDAEKDNLLTHTFEALIAEGSIMRASVRYQPKYCLREKSYQRNQ